MGGAGVCLTPARAAAKETKGTVPLHLNKHKALGQDEVSNWLLKEYTELLAQPISDILNYSYMKQKLPSAWKLVDVTPLPKVKSQTAKEKTSPVSLTSALSKIAEDFVVSDYIKPALEEVVDPNQQFGNISGSSAGTY